MPLDYERRFMGELDRLLLDLKRRGLDCGRSSVLRTSGLPEYWV
jgi:hypothetical protein